MSAYEAVLAAKNAVNAAQMTYERLSARFHRALHEVQVALAQKDFAKADEVLVSAKIGIDEPLELLATLWLGALNWNTPALDDPLDVTAWRWLADRGFPLEAATTCSNFWQAAMQKGSSVIVAALLPLYLRGCQESKGFGWQHNWNIHDLLVPWQWLERHEARLVERLKTFNLLVDARVARIGGATERLVEYADRLTLPPDALAALATTYRRSLDYHVAAGNTKWLIDARSQHPCCPSKVEEMREHFLSVRATLLQAA